MASPKIALIHPCAQSEKFQEPTDSNWDSIGCVFCQELFEFRRIERARDSKHASRAIGVADVDKDMLHAAFLINDGTRGVETVGD